MHLSRKYISIIKKNKMCINDNQKKQNTEKQIDLLTERVIRWDSYRINHFSYTINLILTLNLGFLGFIVSQINFNWSDNIYFLILLIVTFICLIISFYSGVILIINRLNDFRLTSKLTKLKKYRFEYKNELTENSEINTIQFQIQLLSKQTKELGKKTWCLFNLQIWCFVIGTTFGSILFFISKSVL